MIEARPQKRETHMARTLYDIGSDMQALEALLLENDGDISDVSVSIAVEAWERELETDLTGKVDAYVRLIADIEARADARLVESNRIADLVKADTKAADALRERLRFIFETKGFKPVQTDHFKVSLVNNGGKAPLHIRVGMDELPSWAVKSETILSVNKDAIRAALTDGKEVSFASIGERGNRISIK